MGTFFLRHRVVKKLLLSVSSEVLRVRLVASFMSGIKD